MKYFDVATTNNLIFAKGSIQTSPQHLQHLNNAAPVAYIPPHLGRVPESGYQVYLTGYASYVLNMGWESNLAVKLGMILQQLRSIPRPMQGGYKLRGSIDTRKIETPEFAVWYKVNNGQILILNIEPTQRFALQRARAEKTGLYKVKRNEDGSFSEVKATTIDTPYAAVNGQSNDLIKAKWLMAQHLAFEYGTTAGEEYTLFHNPSRGGGWDTWESVQDKLGFTTEMTRQFSALLQQTQQAGKEVKWVAHSQGGIIFAEGVRYFLNGNSSWAMLGGLNGAYKKKEKISLDRHSVAFHGNANNNGRSQVLFERAGIKVHAVRGNDNDFVYNIIGANARNLWSVVGSAVYWRHVTSGSVQQSPHTMAQTQAEWGRNMAQGPGRGRSTVQKGFEKMTRFIPNFMK